VTLSARTRRRLELELQHLDSELLPRARLAVVEARQQGDMSQNPDFFVTAEAEGRLLARRVEIERALALSADSVEVDDRVVLGCLVVLDFGDGPEEFVFGSIEEQHAGVQVLTPSSPVGQAIAGVRAGTQVRMSSGGSLSVVAVRAC
jgi:transcription elongation factor GreA